MGTAHFTAKYAISHGFGLPYKNMRKKRKLNEDKVVIFNTFFK